MKGLLIKDLLMLKNNTRVVLLNFLFFIVIAIISKNPVFLFSGLYVLNINTVLSTINHDTYANWDRYAITMPLDRKDIVLSKYILSAINLLIGSTVPFILSLILKDRFNLETLEILSMLLSMNITMIILLGVLYPIVFKSGIEKARYVLVGAFLVVMMGIFLLLKISEKTNLNLYFNNLNMIKVAILVSLFLSAFIILSIKLSISFFEKKDL